MIFPAKLEAVTFYLPVRNKYYSFIVFASSVKYAMETFYQREAISGKKTTGIRGFRFAMDMTFDQSSQHEKMADFWNDLYQEYAGNGDIIRMYLMDEDAVNSQSDYLEVTIEAFMANFGYRNTVRNHGYSLSFTGSFPQIGIGLVFLLDNADIFVFDNSGQRILVELNPI